jgi:hypothetical protein
LWQWLIVGDAALSLFESVTVTVQLEDVNVVGKAVKQRPGEAFGGEHAGPFIEGQIAGDDNRAAFVALAEDLEPLARTSPRPRKTLRLRWSRSTRGNRGGTPGTGAGFLYDLIHPGWHGHQLTAAGRTIGCL